MRVSRWLRLFFLLALGVRVGAWGAELSRSESTSQKPEHAAADAEATAFFSGPVQGFEVLIGRKELDALRTESRTPVAATVRVGGVTYESVAVHIKGSAGSRRGIDENAALTLSFGKFKPGQTFHGLKKLHLNNSVQDGTRMHEMIGSELYRRAGIPATRVTHGFVKINGNDQGLYVVKEGFDKVWLRRNFPDPGGNLYDGGFLQDVDNDLERDEGSGPDDRADLRGLAAAAELRDVQARREALGQWLDLDQFTTFCALQNLLCDWDGYVYNRNNYRVYREPRTGRFTFLPHGMDQLFGELGFRLDRGMAGLVARQVNELPGQPARMIQRVEALLTNVFTSQVILRVVADAEARLQPALAGRPRGEAQQILEAMRDAGARAVARVDNVRQQTVSRPKPLKFGADGTALVTGWMPRVDGVRAVSDAGPVSAADPTKSLSLQANGEGATGSWRRRLRVPAGRYVFEARIRCEGVQARTDGQGRGIGLRISGRSRTNSLANTAGWTVMAESFQIDEDGELELLVEMRADAGRMWIDLESLRLRRTDLGKREP